MSWDNLMYHIPYTSQNTQKRIDNTLAFMKLNSRPKNGAQEYATFEKMYYDCYTNKNNCDANDLLEQADRVSPGLRSVNTVDQIVNLAVNRK